MHNSIFLGATESNMPTYGNSSVLNGIINWDDTNCDEFCVENSTDIICKVSGKYRVTFSFTSNIYNESNSISYTLQKNGTTIVTILSTIKDTGWTSNLKVNFQRRYLGELDFALGDTLKISWSKAGSAGGYSPTIRFDRFR